jgi:hypothetical protein
MSPSPKGAEYESPGQRPGDAETANTEALKGRDKVEATGLSRPFRADRAIGSPFPQGVALGCPIGALQAPKPDSLATVSKLVANGSGVVFGGPVPADFVRPFSVQWVESLSGRYLRTRRRGSAVGIGQRRVGRFVPKGAPPDGRKCVGGLTPLLHRTLLVGTGAAGRLYEGSDGCFGGRTCHVGSLVLVGSGFGVR